MVKTDVPPVLADVFTLKSNEKIYWGKRRILQVADWVSRKTNEIVVTTTFAKFR